MLVAWLVQAEAAELTSHRVVPPHTRPPSPVPDSLAAPDGLNPGDGPTAGNTLDTTARAAGTAVADGSLVRTRLSVDGPVVRDRLWFGARLGVRAASLDDFRALGGSVDTLFAVQSTPDSRVRVRARHRSTLSTGGRSEEGEIGGDLWLFPIPTVEVESRATAARATVLGDTRDHFGLATRTRFDGWYFGGVHLTELGAGVRYARWEGQQYIGSASLAAISVGDGWRITEDVGVRAAVSAGAVTSSGTRALASPSGAFTWTPHFDPRLSGTLAAQRRWDPAGVTAGGIDRRGRLPRADSASLTVRRDLGVDVSAAVTLEVRSEHVPLLPAPDLVTVAAADPAWFGRTFATVDVRLGRALANRVSAEVGYRHSVPPAPEDAAFEDPLAAWAPTFLDPWRRHAVDGEFSWRLPTDPLTLTVRGEGAWAAAVAGGVGWWTRDRARIGLELIQEFPVGSGVVSLDLGGRWARRDLDAAILPLDVLATDPTAPGLDEQAPLQLTAGVRWEMR